MPLFPCFFSACLSQLKGQLHKGRCSVSFTVFTPCLEQHLVHSRHLYSRANGSLDNFVHSSDGLSLGPQKMEVESQYVFRSAIAFSAF